MGNHTGFPTPSFCKWCLKIILDNYPRNLSFFGFFVFRVGSAPLAILLELDFARDKLPVLARPVVNAVALSAGDPYELIL